jgi:hypothetical protein
LPLRRLRSLDFPQTRAKIGRWITPSFEGVCGHLQRLETRTALRYVQPLREGGSLPAVVDTDDGLYVVKFRGAGQGARALIAELIVGLLAQVIGLRTPELALIDVDPSFGRSEPDPEIQALLRASQGVNVGLRYLDGAFNFARSAAGHLVTPAFATRLVWFDAFVTNPDRTHRNTNLLIWEREPWLIDHGAALYAHHDWDNVDEARTQSPFPRIRDHVLLTDAVELDALDETLASTFSGDVLEGVLQRVPDELLLDPIAGGAFDSAERVRARYVAYLRTRLRAPRAWAAEAGRARAQHVVQPQQRLSERR